MLRIIYAVIRNFFHLHMIPVMRYMASKPEKYSVEDRYNYIRKLSYIVTRASHIHTTFYGQENLPDNGNYILVANHQGKYDALGIVNGHEKPCSLLMDYKRSKLLVVNEIMMMIEGKRLKREDIRQSLSIIMELSDELIKGRPFIIFPEGGYLLDKHNYLYPFKPGIFKSALKAHSTIVPVALIDTYKPYQKNTLNALYNEVHYLEPIPYDEYKNLKTNEIASLVRNRIALKISNQTGIEVQDLFVEPPKDAVLI